MKRKEPFFSLYFEFVNLKKKECTMMEFLSQYSFLCLAEDEKKELFDNLELQAIAYVRDSAELNIKNFTHQYVTYDSKTKETYFKPISHRQNIGIYFKKLSHTYLQIYDLRIVNLR